MCGSQSPLGFAHVVRFVIKTLAEVNQRMSLATRKKGPEFVRFFAPMIDVLRELGESGRPKEVSNRIALKLKIPEKELNKTNKNGQSRLENQVAWARFYLAKAGYIDTSQRGVWNLTDKGRSCKLDHEDALRIFQDIHVNMRGTKREAGIPDTIDEMLPPDKQNEGDDVFRRKMTDILSSLSSGGFERLCQNLLREVGFEEVIVVGRSGDGGIDGYGTLRINKLVSDRVIFQCKRHTKTISPAYIREFRGSMAARADGGIFLATSAFSAEAKREAAREGAAPIEMVDLQGLISLLIDLGLGVNERIIYEVDEDFFRQFLKVPNSESSA